MTPRQDRREAGDLQKLDEDAEKGASSKTTHRENVPIELIRKDIAAHAKIPMKKTPGASWPQR